MGLILAALRFRRMICFLGYLSSPFQLQRLYSIEWYGHVIWIGSIEGFQWVGHSPFQDAGPTVARYNWGKPRKTCRIMRWPNHDSNRYPTNRKAKLGCFMCMCMYICFGRISEMLWKLDMDRINFLLPHFSVCNVESWILTLPGSVDDKSYLYHLLKNEIYV